MKLNRRNVGFAMIVALVAAATMGGLIRTGTTSYDQVIEDIGGARDFAIKDVKDVTNSGQIGFVNKCSLVASGSKDPIVYPKESADAHLHDFIGNKAASFGNVSLSQMASTQTECRITDDRSALWAPAVYQDGTKLNVTQSFSFYRGSAFDGNLDEVEPIPFGLQMIAGDAEATSNQSSSVGWWQNVEDGCILCVSDTHTRRASEMITSEGDGLRLRVSFPNCWNGKDLDSPDHKSHVAYASNNGECPDTHPVKIAQLMWFGYYKKAIGGPGLTLSSGPWYTFHAGFVNLWEPDTMEALTKTCIHERKNCTDIFSDNALSQFWGDATLFERFWTNADHVHVHETESLAFATTTTAPAVVDDQGLSSLYGYLFGDGNYVGNDKYFFRTQNPDMAAKFRDAALLHADEVREGKNNSWITFNVTFNGQPDLLTRVPDSIADREAFAAAVIEGEGNKRSGLVLDDGSAERRDSFAELMNEVGVSTRISGRDVFAEESSWPVFEDWPFVVCTRVPGPTSC